MKEIYAQFRPDGLPLSIQAHDTLSEAFKYNQWMKLQCYRVGKDLGPSIEQHNTLFACFNMIVGNNSHPWMKTIDGVKEACKAGIDFRDPNIIIVRPDGGIQFVYRSFSFKSLPPGRERDVIMQKAFEWCSGVLGYEGDAKETAVDKMIKEAKSRMLSS